MNNNNNQIAGAILVVGILIAGAILLRGTNAPTNNNNTRTNTNPIGTTQWQGRPVSGDDHITGNPNAEIVIVEYSDLECPFCKVFHNTMRQVLSANDNVAWVYRHYPIPQLHQKAFREAEATECAWEQGGNEAFWNYTDRIFEVTTSNDGLPDTELPNIAGEVGLDVAKFTTCLNSGKYRNKVQADVDDGVKAGVSGTPSSFILQKGKLVAPISGAQPYATVIQMLDSLR
jgi:protein-disulfide isomerase